jgi:hypothetical protein
VGKMMLADDNLDVHAEIAFPPQELDDAPARRRAPGRGRSGPSP